MSMSNRVKCAVLAIDADAARSYATNRRLPDWFYVQSAQALRAAGPVRVEMTGNWRARGDLKEIVATMDEMRDEGLLR